MEIEVKNKAMNKRMQSIIDFLDERPMISIRGIEQAVGLPNATIKKEIGRASCRERV